MLKVQCGAKLLFNRAEKCNYFAWLACLISSFSIFIPISFSTYVVYGIPFLADILYFILNFISQKNVRDASHMRKYFDSYVLDINVEQFSNSESMIIKEKAETLYFKNKRFAKVQMNNTGADIPPGVRNWYEFSELCSGNNAIFECQKSNIWWTKKILHYNILFLLLLIIIEVIGVIGVIMLSPSYYLLLCFPGIIIQTFERLYFNSKYYRVSLEIDGARSTVESSPDRNGIENLQDLIERRREINVIGINCIHKHCASKLTSLYNTIRK